MTPTDQPAYGLWLMVILNSAVFIVFALSFARPQSDRAQKANELATPDARFGAAWRSFAARTPPSIPRLGTRAPASPQ